MTPVVIYYTEHDLFSTNDPELYNKRFTFWVEFDLLTENLTNTFYIINPNGNCYIYRYPDLESGFINDIIQTDPS